MHAGPPSARLPALMHTLSLRAPTHRARDTRSPECPGPRCSPPPDGHLRAQGNLEAVGWKTDPESSSVHHPSITSQSPTIASRPCAAPMSFTQLIVHRPVLRDAFLALRCALLLVPWLFHLLLADLCLSALLPLSTAFPNLTYDVASRIAESVWRGVQQICVDRNNARICITGDELPQGESAVVVANHVEWADFYLIQALAIRAGMLGRCRWFAKRQLKWVPFLGWGLWAMGMPLVSRKWTQDRQEMERLFRRVGLRPLCMSCVDSSKRGNMPASLLVLQS